MSVKRRDKKNRILRNGESQRSDGRYVYVYVDGNGKQRFLYSWKLESTDKLPQGKRDCVSLRDKIKMLQKDLDDGITPNGGGVTVLELVRKYTGQKTGVRYNTKSRYNHVIQIVEKEGFGTKRIDRVKVSDAKQWVVKLQKDGKSYSTIQGVRSVMRPAFQLAVEDDLIRKNPFDFSLSTIIANDSEIRVALTEAQQGKFLEFVKNDRHYSRYYDAIYILFHTGLRISEFTGLLESDIDFENQWIRVDHQLLSISVNHHMVYVIEDTKTRSGVRYVPMIQKVAESFRKIIEAKNQKGDNLIIDGVRGFLFTRKGNLPVSAQHWEEYFRAICKKYNQVHIDQMPRVSPHVCRHTFCSNMARRGMNPKTLQYIMGHSDISVTLNTYTHVNYEDSRKEMARVWAEY